LSSNSVCIIGAGISGLTVANNLVNAGIEVTLVERNPYPGGRALFYGCKASDSCVHCGVCLIREAVMNFRRTHNIKSQFSSELTGFSRSNGEGILLEIETHPNIIDWRLCTECGKCIEACPENAVKIAPGWKYYVDSGCNDCGKCVDVCPEGAIALKRESMRESIHADCLVIASGFKPFDPSVNRKWSYGESPRIITGSDLEELFYTENYLPGVVKKSDCKRIAFLQCVGSRNVTEGGEYCSRVCCAYALQMAGRLKDEFPHTEIDFYYMDIQHFGKDFESFFGDVSRKVNFINSNPITFSVDRADRPVVRYESITEQKDKEEAYDLVVLSNGIAPGDKNEALAKMTGLSLDKSGFLYAMNGMGGVFVTGACKQPMRIEDCIEDATGVTGEVLSYLEERVQVK